MREDKKISILVLAAGESSRMGQIKQLLPWKDSTLIEHCIQQCLEALANNVIVVLGANSSEIKNKIEQIESVEIIVNPDWKSGMLSSIKAGLRYSEDSQAILVVLSDQPSISTEYLNSLVNTFQDSGRSIVATDYNQNIGVPAIFGKSHFNNILALENDNGGAKSYIIQQIEEVSLIKPDFEVFDIDNKEQYDHYFQIFH